MRTKVIIHIKKLNDNIKSIREIIGKDKLICVPVKSDAYGHGMLQIAEACVKAGVNCLGITAVSEGVELRKNGIKAPILIFSQPHPDEISLIINENLTPFVSDMEFASILNEQVIKTNRKFEEIFGSSAKSAKLPVHIKIDSGMGRIGCRFEDDECLALARFVSSSAGLKLAGVATHFAVSDSTEKNDIEYTKKQLEYFRNAVEAIKAEGIEPGTVHAANSGAILLHKDSWLDMVRPGILVYGYKTAEESEIHAQGSLLEKAEKIKNQSDNKKISVEPVMELRSSVSLIKKIKKGESVSYGRTWTAEKDTYIGILPAGYADGFPRLASNKWQVIINSEKYPIIGRICMNQCCVDLGSELKVKRWDEAVIFGGEAEDAAALAEVAGTIPYEITCNAGKRTNKVYI